jgi:uncharacterized damage-inducible protein DinB
MKAANLVAEAVRQMSEGEDFFNADDLTRDISPESACKVPTGSPYSIGTQVAHALVWQDVWLAKIKGDPAIEVTDEMDFPVVDCADWPELRGRFIAETEMAEALATSEDLTRPIGNTTVGELLLQIAIHNSYHIGQIALLRQLSGLGMPVYDSPSHE